MAKPKSSDLKRILLDYYIKKARLETTLRKFESENPDVTLGYEISEHYEKLLLRYTEVQLTISILKSRLGYPSGDVDSPPKTKAF